MFFVRPTPETRPNVPSTVSLLGLVPSDDATEAEIKILVSEVTALHMREATFLHCRAWTAGESAKSEDGSWLKEDRWEV